MPILDIKNKVKDIMVDENWYAKWYKERYNKHFSSTEIKKYEPASDKPKLTEDFKRELKKEPRKIEEKSRYLNYRRKEELENNKEDSTNKPPYKEPISREVQKPIENNKAEPVTNRVMQSKSIINNYYKPKYVSKPLPVEPQLKKQKPDPQLVLKELKGKVKSDFNKSYLILISLVIVLIILGTIYFLTQTNPKASFQPIDIKIYNSSGVDSYVYFKDKFMLSISGWQSKIEYLNKTDRLFGNDQYKKIVFDNKGKAYTAIYLDNELRLEPLTTNPDKVTRIGWFAKQSEFSYKETKTLSKKQINLLFSSTEDSISNASLTYNLFKNKPYFKIKFNASGVNNTGLGDFSYGLILSGYDVYSENGEIIINDNEITKLNKTLDLTLLKDNNITKNISKDVLDSLSKKVDLSRIAISRKGSSYTDNSEYQLFVNKNKTLGILIYSPYILYFEDSFYWNVFWINVIDLDNGDYAPLYIAVIEKPELNYNNETKDWFLSSKQYKGPVKSYISEIVNNIGDNIVE